QGLLNITDYRGTGAGWKLEAQAGELKNAAGQKLAGSLLLAGVAKTDETDNNPTAISQAELVLEGSGVQVWNAASGPGQGRNTGVFTSADTVLKLSQNTAAYGGKYQTAITWTLTNAPA
ncbi:MAG: WxL domain-containing protein, partial [Lacticaseibacillus paracasei]